MIRCWRFISIFLLFSASIVAAAVPLTAENQSPAVSTQENDAPAKSQPKDFGGNWQVAWTNRGGTQQCILRLQQDGQKLTGTFQDGHGTSPLSGTVDEKQITFNVQFGGRYPFTIQFSGIATGGSIEGTSKAIGVEGAFLGHGGEIVHPEHPWTAKRLAGQSIQSSGASPNPSTPAKN